MAEWVGRWRGLRKYRYAGPKGDNVGAVDEATMTDVVRALSEFVAALVEADGGKLYVVRATSEDVHIHLTGTCAGCPGATMTRERLLEPALLAVAPKAALKVTTGWRIPDGAKKVEPA